MPAIGVPEIGDREDFVLLTTSQNCFAERSRDRGDVVLSQEQFRHVGRRSIGDFVFLFFVRVNQVLVRLWTRNQLSGFGVRLSEVSDHRPPGTDGWSCVPVDV
jgi:hypothetical protein